MDFATVIRLAAILLFLAFWVAAFFIIYHLARFGVGLLPKRLAALFLVGAVTLFSASIIFYSGLEPGSLPL